MILDYRERRYYLVRLNDGMYPFWLVKGHDNHGKCDVDKIENIFREILVHDDYFRYVELTKEICGQ